MEPSTIELVKDVLTDAIKILGPAIITAFVAYRSFKEQFAIEKLRLHDKDRIEAHKRLFLFARKMSNETFPLADNKLSAFKCLMKKEYFGKIDIDSVYYPDAVIEILDKLESQYICMTRGELIPEMDEKELELFIENELFNYAKKLRKAAKSF